MTDSDVPAIDIYALYKPLRNQLWKLDTQGLLTLIWQLSRDPFGPAVIKVRDASGRSCEIFCWELHLLAREVLLHATRDPRRKQPEMRDLFALINHLRRISEGTSEKAINSSERAAQALHPLIHQQARWQHTRDWDRFHRAFRIYNRDDVRPLLEAVVGVRLSTIYTLTFAIAGAAQKSPAVIANNDYSFMGISNEERDAYFAMVSAPLASLRDVIEQRQRYDEGWAYTWNPIEGTPLIQLDAGQPQQYLCPLPQFLFRRATESLFFDLGKSEAKFDNPYGTAFQEYVGDVLRAQFKGPLHRVLEEQTYRVNRNQKHGVDWIVSDASGHIMFECKTRRIKVDAKAIMDGSLLTEALEDLCAIVVQHYKNVHDARCGLTRWKSDGKPVYPIIITYEDWYLFAPHVVRRLDSLVHEKLAKIGLTELLESSPFIVTSIAEFEGAGQAIAQIGIDTFCASRVASADRHFGLGRHASYAFSDIPITYDRLFENSGEEMFGHLSHLMDLPKA